MAPSVAVDGMQQAFQHIKVAFGAIGQRRPYPGLGCLAQLPDKVAHPLKAGGAWLGHNDPSSFAFFKYLTVVKY